MQEAKSTHARFVRGGDIVPALAHVVILDDDVQLGGFLARGYDWGARGSLRVAHCADSRAFRSYIQSLVGGRLPLVLVTSDFRHGDPDGIDDLSFLRDVPGDLAAGGVRLTAAATVLQTAHGSPAVAVVAQSLGAEFVEKPVRMTDCFALLRRSVCRLIEGLEAELEAAPEEDFLRGPLTWGTAKQVRSSLQGLKSFAAMTAEGRVRPRL